LINRAVFEAVLCCVDTSEYIK